MSVIPGYKFASSQSTFDEVCGNGGLQEQVLQLVSDTIEENEIKLSLSEKQNLNVLYALIEYQPNPSDLHVACNELSIERARGQQGKAFGRSLPTSHQKNRYFF